MLFEITSRPRILDCYLLFSMVKTCIDLECFPFVRVFFNVKTAVIFLKYQDILNELYIFMNPFVNFTNKMLET